MNLAGSKLAGGKELLGTVQNELCFFFFFTGRKKQEQESHKRHKAGWSLQG